MNLHETGDSYQDLFIDVFLHIIITAILKLITPTDSDSEQEYLNEQPPELLIEDSPTLSSSMLINSNPPDGTQPYFAFSEASESGEAVDDELDSRYEFDDLDRANDFITYLKCKLSINSKTLEDNEKKYFSQISKLCEQNLTLTNQLNILDQISLQDENVELKKKLEISNQLWNEMDSRDEFHDLHRANDFITYLKCKLSINSKTLEDNEKKYVSQISKLYEQNLTLTNQLNTLAAGQISLQDENVELKKKLEISTQLWNEFPPMYKKETWNWGVEVKFIDVDSILQITKTLENVNLNLEQEKKQLEVTLQNLEHSYNFIENAKKDSDQLFRTFRSQNEDKEKEIEALRDTVSKSGSEISELQQEKKQLESLYRNLQQEIKELEIIHQNLEHSYDFIENAKNDSDQLVHTFRSQNDDKKKEIEALEDAMLSLYDDNNNKKKEIEDLKDSLSNLETEISELCNQNKTSDNQLKGFETSMVLTKFKKSSQSAKALLQYTKYGALLHIYDFIMYSVKLGKMMVEDRLESALTATCGLCEDSDNEKLKERTLKFSKSVMQANVKKIFDEIHESSISLKKSINTYTENQIDINPIAWTLKEICKLRGKIILEALNSVESGEISLLQLHEDLNEIQKNFMEASVHAFLSDPSLEIGPSDNKDSINKREYMRNASFINKIPQRVKQALRKITFLPVLPGLYICGEDGSITFKEKFFVSDMNMKYWEMD
ncbi:hypothetical protein HK096_004233 [Nowakowskiella sp. JEL0078]|nr:hypothetical protein HK096_004233 [Nowakowskiella sp. JEL0078]